MSDGFHLVAIHLDARTLAGEIRRAGLPRRHVDDDYLIHAALHGLFGPGVAQPFHHEAAGARSVRVLAYSDRDINALTADARTHADPEWFGAVDWDRAASKPMPSAFELGTKLGFASRLCPVVRVPRGHPTSRPGAERDAFLHACDRAGPTVDVDRDTVYRSWVTDRFASAGVEILTLAIDGFQLKVQTRRRATPEGRKARQSLRPVLDISGTLVVRDTKAFQHRLRSGLGRHKAFGFGMIRVRRPS